MYQTDQYEGMIAETVTMRGHNGDTINAYVARPLGAGPFPGGEAPIGAGDVIDSLPDAIRGVQEA